MTNKMDEQILVVPRKELFEEETLAFQGTSYDESLLDKIMTNAGNHYTVMRRGDAEENQAFKQPIPYVIIRRGNQVYAYERLTGGGEARLHNQVSIGVGGHANLIKDKPFIEQLMENAKREIKEELYIDGYTSSFEVMGLVNDDINDVGKVHIGLLAVLDLQPYTEVTVRETNQLKGFWINIDELLSEDVYASLESWSQYAAERLNK